MKLQLASTLFGVSLSLSVAQLTRILAHEPERGPASLFARPVAPPPPLSSSSRERIKSGGALDVGALPSRGSTSNSRHLQTASCPDGMSVACVGGYLNGGDTPCYEACSGDCCVGTDACYGFTGTLCRDNVSCNGEYACSEATIETIVGGCEGNRACGYAADKGGSTLLGVFGGCIGNFTCYGMADYEGSVGLVIDSCIGNSACLYAANAEGTIDGVQDSCIGDLACEHMGYYGGSVGAVSGSCNGTNACGYLGAFGGAVGNVTNSCIDEISCNRAASCEDADNDQCGSAILEITDSCVGLGACERAAGLGGEIGGIRSACRAPEACRDAGTRSDIPSGIDSCCSDAIEICTDVTEATLPGECVIPIAAAPSASPTAAPISSPTAEPSTTPTGAPTSLPSESAVPTATLVPTSPPSTAAPTASSTRGRNIEPTAPVPAQPSSKGAKAKTKNGKSKKGKGKSSKTEKERTPLAAGPQGMRVKRKRRHKNPVRVVGGLRPKWRNGQRA